MTPPNLLTEWARLLVGALARAGVTDAVLSPGSRSTPFTWAALREPRLRCHTIIDERCAAFFAVGQAKMTGIPSLLVCTSGSAPANYLPAIIEADRSGTPLLVLTADRPFELQATDASQTIDQVKLYGEAVRRFFELGAPDALPAALAGLRRVASQAALLARGPLPGPVHLNARARKPLEPRPADGDDARALAAAVDRLLEEAMPLAPPPLLIATDDAIETVARACADASRGVIVCGPTAPWQAPRASLVQELATVTGFPILAESTSQLRFVPRDDHVLAVDAFDALLRSAAFREQFRPDVVLRIGGPPTSTAWRELTASELTAGEATAGERTAAGAAARVSPMREYVLTPNGWSDPNSSAAAMLVCSLGPALEALVRRIDTAGSDGDAAIDALDSASRDADDWTDFLSAAQDAATAVLDAATLDAGTLHAGTADAAAPDLFDEGVAVRTIADAIPAGSLLCLGNSLPVREIDTFARGGDRELVVWSQRGASGIDGLISGAAGAAAAAGTPCALLLGDVSALHDVGGLVVARGCATPLAIVVLDNGGGRIFEQLPLAAEGTMEPADWQTWLTPPDVDFASLAAAFGIGYARATDATAAHKGLQDALARPGATLLHVVVDGARTLPAHEAYWRDVERRVSALP